MSSFAEAGEPILHCHQNDFQPETLFGLDVVMITEGIVETADLL